MNYIEFVILPQPVTSNGEQIISTSWDVEQFDNIVQKTVANARQFLHLKPFVKNTKTYVKDSLYMESESDCELRVFDKAALNYRFIANNVIQLVYNKKKVPMHTFPSTTSIHNVMHVQTLTIRIHNRVFINFEVQDAMQNKLSRRIYINYNHEDSVNKQYMHDRICQAFSLLDVTVPTFEICHETCKSS